LRTMAVSRVGKLTESDNAKLGWTLAFALARFAPWKFSYSKKFISPFALHHLSGNLKRDIGQYQCWIIFDNPTFLGNMPNQRLLTNPNSGFENQDNAGSLIIDLHHIHVL
jgi:hypothetical protein